MPKRPHIPGESEEYPEYVPVASEYDEEEPEAVYEPVEEKDDMIYDDKERDLLNDEGTTREDVSLTTNKNKLSELDMELETLKQKKLERELEKQKKQNIKDKKKEIRHLKYEPAYEAGEKLKSGMTTLGSKFGSFVAKKRGTPAQREARRAKTQMKMKKLAAVAKKKAVSFGKSMKEQKQGGGSFNKSFLGNSAGNSGLNFGQGTPKILQNNRFGNKPGSRLMGQNKTSFFDNKMGMTSNLKGNTPRIMQGNILGNVKKTKKGKKKQVDKPGLKLMSGRIKL